MNLPNPFPGIAVPVTTPQVSATPITQPSYKFKKAGKNGNLITVVLDESSSMGSCWDATLSGFNEFVQGQKTAGETAGAAALTVIKFNGFSSSTIFDAMPIENVSTLTKEQYRPSGNTNLLDAIGDAITKVNGHLQNLKKKDRPGVIITIMTDGEENSSRRYTNTQIKEMVKAAELADWTFVFLGANIDAFAVGSTFGMSAANSVNYSTQQMGATMAAISESTTRMRTAKLAGTSTLDLYSTGIYNDAELKSMK